MNIKIIFNSLPFNPKPNNKCIYFRSGAIDCKETVEYHTEYRELEDFLTTWMQGYISGIDTALEQDFARNVDADYLYLSVINRCKSRPDEYMHEAVRWLYKSVMSKIKFLLALCLLMSAYAKAETWNCNFKDIGGKECTNFYRSERTILC